MTTAPVLFVNEKVCAAAIGMTVAYLRKDRRTKRIVPFVKIGDSVRYSLDDVKTQLTKAAA